MKLKQVSVSIENASGRLFEVTSALAEAGINLRALSLADTGDFGLLRILVSDLTTTRRILMEKQLPAQVNEVVAAELEDKPGSLAGVLQIIDNSNLHVVYMYAVIGFSSGKAVMIFHFSDNDAAIEVLEKNGVTLLDAKAFGIMETNGQE